MSATPLSDRDINAQPKSATSDNATDEKPKTLEYHRQVLHDRLNGDKTQQYASPTAEIMSPATQKLSAFRQKHITKKSKPQTLFKKTSSKNYESAKGMGGFADIGKE